MAVCFWNRFLARNSVIARNLMIHLRGTVAFFPHIASIHNALGTIQINEYFDELLKFAAHRVIVQNRFTTK